MAADDERVILCLDINSFFLAVHERDDASLPLLDPHFGHCSQEGLNLLLAGVGVSNVFDGSRDLGGGFSTLRVRSLTLSAEPAGSTLMHTTVTSSTLPPGIW